MKRSFALSAAALGAVAATAATQPEFRFSGEIQADELSSTAFIQPVASGYVRFLDLDPGLRLELAAPRQDNDEAVTLVRLLQQDDGDYKILHEARISGSSEVERSFTYRVCGSEVTFFAPAPTKTPQCADH